MHKVSGWLEAGLLSAISIFAPIKSLLFTTAVMITIDLITGIMAATKQKQPITSAGLRRTVSKIFVYEVAIMLAYLAETYMSDILPFVKMASSMITLVELKSIYENLSVLQADDVAIKVLIDKLGSESKKDIRKDE